MTVTRARAAFVLLAGLMSFSVTPAISADLRVTVDGIHQGSGAIRVVSMRRPTVFAMRTMQIG